METGNIGLRQLTRDPLGLAALLRQKLRRFTLALFAVALSSALVFSRLLFPQVMSVGLFHSRR
jgi:hypothetical protein